MRIMTRTLGSAAVAAAVIAAAVLPLTAAAAGPVRTADPASANTAASATASTADAAKDAYLFAYFTGEQYGGEQIRFGLSKGNDALHWIDLNNGDPVLTSTMGTTGLRDPFIMRSHDGTKFYLLATDLKIYPNGNFTVAQQTGSLNLEIWESTDLVHWGAQREVKVSNADAGNTWAPEAYWDDATQQYIVFWASALYASGTSPAARSISTSYQRMMYATTQDFTTFSAPQAWTDVKRGTGLGMIDSDVIKEGDYYYRFTKDEAYMIPRLERSKVLTATESGSLAGATADPAAGWQLVKEKVGQGLANQWGGTFTGGEGPTVFKANAGDVTAGGLPTWYLFMDQPSYHGGKGYVPFATHDLSDPNGWSSVAAQSELPTSPRHGTVLPITQGEYDRLLAAYQPDQLVTSIDDATVTTVASTPVELPKTVRAHYSDGSVKDAPATWPAVDAAVWQTPGIRTIPAATPVAGSPKTDTLTIVVGDGHAPVTTLSAPAATGTGGWHTAAVDVTATATDDSGVAQVHTALDGTTADAEGATATVHVTGDGTHTVTASATDVYRTDGATSSTSVQIDGAAPLSKAGYDAATRTLTLAAEDATSGVARIEYRLAGGDWAPYGAPIAVPDSVDSVAYRAVDKAGNVETTRTQTMSTAVIMRDTATAVTLDASRVKAGKDDVEAMTAVTTGGKAVTNGYVLVRATRDDTEAFSALVPAGGTVTIPRTALNAKGTYTVTARFLGTATLNPSSASAALTVK